MNRALQINRRMPLNLPRTDSCFFIGISILLALALRACFIHFAGYDYMVFVERWYDYIKSHGGFTAMKDNFSNYTPPYLYLLTIATYLPFPKIWSIKLVSIVFDYAAAILAALIVKEKLTNEVWSKVAFSVMLFAPTVWFNSALWGQCDIIYTTWLLACIFCLIKGRNVLAVVFYSIAFAFKFQAVFLAPLLLILFLKKQIRFRSFFIIPAVYIIAILPAFIAGRPLVDLLKIYIDQKGVYNELTMAAPNLYQWLSNEYFEMFTWSGLIMTVFLVILLCYIVYKSGRPADSDLIIKTAMVFALLIPFTLPQMHDRYFFVADVVSILFAFSYPKYFFIPPVIWFASFFSCYSFVFYKKPVITHEYLAFLVLAVLGLVLRDYIRFLFQNPVKNTDISKL